MDEQTTATSRETDRQRVISQGTPTAIYKTGVGSRSSRAERGGKEGNPVIVDRTKTKTLGSHRHHGTVADSRLVLTR